MAAGDPELTLRSAIEAAESGTTGEIRVHLTRDYFVKDAMREAERLFASLGMHRTTHRNAVLLYVNLRRKNFAILGDEALHAHVGALSWRAEAHKLETQLKAAAGSEAALFRALAEVVNSIGIKLKTHFPLEVGQLNPNELPDDVST